MSTPAIKVEGLGKRYRIGAAVNRHRTLRDALGAHANRVIGTVGRRLRGDFRRQIPETIWALRDVDFEVEHGETVGIIGSNGAGKSTLLKVLSRITEPTEGRVEIRGRVGSLLEVGTGFHPELSGRENTYLNGAILGMTRQEINKKFDEIVAFAEVERFIDTPVKHYSSGMYLRLAFAVAAHLEPEILIVDEVLSVGDASFQQKCLGKMGDVAHQGRTVLFVSHNLAAVRALCSRAIVLDSGKMVATGAVESCINRYATGRHRELASTWSRPVDKPGGPLTIEYVAVGLEGKQPKLRLAVDLTLSSRGKHKPAFVAVDVRDLSGTPVMQAIPVQQPFICDTSAKHALQVVIELGGIVPGGYGVTVWVGSHNRETLDLAEDVAMFEVHQSPIPGRCYPHTADHGFVVPPSFVSIPADAPIERGSFIGALRGDSR
jgi:lipopolysaccharide transport system ATP-binding protein